MNTPLNDSLNNSVRKFGMPTMILFVVVMIGVVTMLFFNFLLGAFLLFGIPALSRLLVFLDPKIYRLAALSLSQSHCYDARKRVRAK